MKDVAALSVAKVRVVYVALVIGGCCARVFRRLMLALLMDARDRITRKVTAIGTDRLSPIHAQGNRLVRKKAAWTRTAIEK